MYSPDNPNHHFTSNDQYNPTSSPAELVCKYRNAHFSPCSLDAVWINVLTELELIAQEESVDSEYSEKRIQVSADGTYKCLYKGCDASSISVSVHFIHQGNGNE